MPAGIFSSQHDFKQAFERGLYGLLEQSDLGCFILVCANAFGDPQLHEKMLPDIELRFRQLREAVSSGALERGEVTASDDDRLIFLKLMQQELSVIPVVQYRHVGHWRCQFNHLRTFRPARMATQKLTSLQQPFDDKRFNFNKPFLQKERLWEGKWDGTTLSWYYNKFPFARYHGLLVPEREQGHSQYLTEALHQFIWNLVQQCATSMTGLGAGYNSLGAFASVNHLHFQWFIEPGGLPIMSGQWQHNGGNVTYPLNCYRFTDVQSAWRQIMEWHAQSVAYNLIYTKGAVYAIARSIQSQIAHKDWTSGFSWIETAGEMVIQNADDFTMLTEADIESEMAKLRLAVRGNSG